MCILVNLSITEMFKVMIIDCLLDQLLYKTLSVDKSAKV